MISQLKGLILLRYRLFKNYWKNSTKLYQISFYLTLITFGVMSIFLGLTLDGLVSWLDELENVDKQFFFQFCFTGVLTLISFVWLIMPLMFIMQYEGFDLAPLVLYPFTHHQLHLLNLLMGAVEPWALFLYPALIGLSSGFMMTYGFSVGINCFLVIFLFCLVHIVWGRALIEMTFSIFASRRLKEVFFLLIILVILLFSFLPTFLTMGTGPDQADAELIKLLKNPQLIEQALAPFSLFINLIYYFTPAGMVAQGLIAISKNHWYELASIIAWLLIFLYLGGILSSSALRRIYRKNATQEQSNQQKKPLVSFRIPFISTAAQAIVFKEFRYLFRSIIGKLIFVLTPIVLVLIQVPMAQSAQVSTASSDQFVMLGYTSYIFMTSVFLFSNIFGWDGEGFKVFILTPVPYRDVLIGKNIAFGLFIGLEFLLTTYLYLILFELPQFSYFVFVILTFIMYLFGVLGLGNLLSIRYPTYIDLSNTRYQQKSSPIMLSFGIVMLLSFTSVLTSIISWWSNESLWIIASAFCLASGISYFILFPYSIQLLQQEAPEILYKVTQRD